MQELDYSVPPEFLKFVNDPLSLTAEAARRFKVTSDMFVNWRWQMSHQLTNETNAKETLTLAAEEDQGFRDLATLFNAGVTPYYAALMGPPSQTPPCPIRLQALPRAEELFDPIGEKDPLLEKDHSPVREVVHVYPDRVAFCVAMLCPVYCRYCFRKRRDEEPGLHFNRGIVDRGIAYIASNPAIRDVLITGGDPFIASDSTLESLLQRLRAIPHVEIIRFGTRTPVTLPYRVTDSLCKMIARYHPVFVNTHFNCAEELTPEALQAVQNLVNNGIPVGNQSVLLRHINDSYDRMLTLLRGLLKARIRPYYVFHPHRIAGTEHLRVSLREGMAMMKKLRGQITGLGLPSYILDTPSGKVPLAHNYMLREDGDDLIVEDIRGEIWREPNVL